MFCLGVESTFIITKILLTGTGMDHMEKVLYHTDLLTTCTRENINEPTLPRILILLSSLSSTIILGYILATIDITDHLEQ